jgi:hypothetical protein
LIFSAKLIETGLDMLLSRRAGKLNMQARSSDELFLLPARH